MTQLKLVGESEPETVVLRAGAVEAAVTVEDVRREFYNAWATGDRYFWWIREMFIDPGELIVADDNDDIYRMSYDIEGDAISFGDPHQARVEYVDVKGVPKTELVAAAVAGMRAVRGPKVAASYSSRAESRPEPQEGGSVDLSQLRKILNLSADVSDDEVLRQAATKLGAAPEPAPSGDPPPANPDDPGEPTPEPDEGDAGAASPASPESSSESTSATVTLDRAAYEQLKNGAQMGVAARTEQLKTEENRILAQAKREGRFPPAREEHYRTAMKSDREGTIKLLTASVEDGGLAPGLVPVDERGVQGESEGVQAEGGYPANWLPDVSARKANMAADRRGRVTMEHPRTLEGVN